MPGVPLEKLTPAWIPGRLLIGYLTGAMLLVAGACILLAKKTRIAATYLGTWILLLVLFIYVPILIAQLFDKVPALKAMAPTKTEPPFKISQLVVLVLFVVLTIAAAKKFHDEPVRAA